MARKLLLAVLAVAVVAMLGVVALRLPAVQTWLARISLPAFPDYPPPKEALSAGDQGTVYFATHSPFDLQVILSERKGAPTTGLGYLTFPEGDGGSLPAMILLPGSGGIQPGREHEYAQFLNGLGIAAFVVEYYAPRGLSEETNYLIRTGSVTEFDLIADAYAALRLLGTHPRVDDDRIGLVGFSYGGMAARLAMDGRIRQSLAPEHRGFKAHIDIYGPCFQNLGTKITNGAPLLTLRGTEDASNDLSACSAREQELRDIGVQVVSRIYQGAGHAWENAQARFFREESPYVSGCEWRYDEDGVPWVDGERLVRYGADASRAERIASRLASGDRLRDCVKWGYIIGRDEEVRSRAFEDAAAFLKANL